MRCVFAITLGCVVATVLFAEVCEGAISVSLANSTFGTARTSFNQLELYNGNIKVKFIDSAGRLRDADYIVLSFQRFRDIMKFKRDDANPGCEQAETQWVTPATWIIWTKPGLNGTTLFGMNASYAQVCETSMFFTLTDHEMEIRVANFTVSLRPDVLKLSVSFTCPWKQVLLNQNLSIAEPTDALRLYGRHHVIGTRMLFQFSSPIIDYPQLQIGNLNYTTIAWGVFQEQLCSGQRPELRPFPDGHYPVQPLNPSFDFLSESGMLIPSENFAASMYFLGWALSDGSELGRIIASGDVSGANASARNGYIDMPYELEIPFANYAFYDPSLQLIFFDSNSQNQGLAPNQTPAVVEQILAESNTLAIALGISMPLILFGAAAAIIFGIARRKRIESREFARVKNKIDKTQSFEADAAPLAKPEPKSAESKRPKSEWKTASKAAGPLRNV